jgi:hypothetical protein
VEEAAAVEAAAGEQVAAVRAQLELPPAGPALKGPAATAEVVTERGRVPELAAQVEEAALRVMAKPRQPKRANHRVPQMLTPAKTVTPLTSSAVTSSIER